MITVNAEYQEKMLLLNRLNADLDNMAKAAGVATVFVDESMQITRFSPDATQVFKLRDTDIGRPLDDIAHILDYPSLMSDIASTLRSGRMIEREVRSLDDTQIFLMRVLPYVIQSSMKPGAVTTLVDITELHNAQRLQAIIDALPEHVAVLDPTGTIIMVNAAWTRFALANGGIQGSAMGVGTNYLEVCAYGTNVDDGHNPDAQASVTAFTDDRGSPLSAARGIRGVLGGELAHFTLEYPCHSPTEQRWFVMNVAPVRHPGLGAVVSHINRSALRSQPS
jgi:two-component system CheB/CheR fusion protein